MPVGKRTLSTTPIALYYRERTRKLKELGLCSCGRPIAVGRSITQCTICLERNRKSWAVLKAKVHAAYGNKCACCGETEPKFLSIDHKEGNGNQHRMQVGGSKKSPILRWLVKNNFPSEFQLLCHNCNVAKGCYGVCPHQDKQAG